MLPAELALEEEGHVPHDRITRKNDVPDTLPEVRHRQRFWWFAILQEKRWPNSQAVGMDMGWSDAVRIILFLLHS